jgi:cytochrome c-type biogenesis protein CcmH/NrfF
MWPFTVFVTAFALALAATTLVFGVGIVGVPVALVVLAVGFLIDFRRRRNQERLLHHHRQQARENKVDFTPRDRETLVPNRSRSSGGG